MGLISCAAPCRMRSMVRAYCNSDTNGDWVVEVDGIRRARFIAYDRNSAARAARLANELRKNAPPSALNHTDRSTK